MPREVTFPKGLRGPQSDTPGVVIRIDHVYHYLHDSDRGLHLRYGDLSDKIAAVVGYSG